MTVLTQYTYVMIVLEIEQNSNIKQKKKFCLINAGMCFHSKSQYLKEVVLRYLQYILYVQITESICRQNLNFILIL